MSSLFEFYTFNAEVLTRFKPTKNSNNWGISNTLLLPTEMQKKGSNLLSSQNCRWWPLLGKDKKRTCVDALNKSHLFVK